MVPFSLMQVRDRVILSLIVLATASVATKLWTSTLSEQEVNITRIIEEAEANRQRAEAEKSSTHAAFALGLCSAVRILMDEPDIEKLTGVHITSYEATLNALLYQYTRSRHRARSKKTDKSPS